MKAKLWLLPFGLGIVATILGLYGNLLFSTLIGGLCVGVSYGVIMSHNCFMKSWVKEDYTDSLQLTGSSRSDIE